MGDEASRNRLRLGERVQARRHELNLKIAELARKRGALYANDCMDVESGKAVKEDVYRQLDAALEWAPGTCIKIVQGAPLGEVSEQAVSKAVLAALAEHADFPADKIRIIRDSVIQDLKDREVL